KDPLGQDYAPDLASDRRRGARAGRLRRHQHARRAGGGRRDRGARPQHRDLSRGGAGASPGRARRRPGAAAHRPGGTATGRDLPHHGPPMLAVTAARHAWLALALAVAPGSAAPSTSTAPAPTSASASTSLFTPGIRDAAHPGRWARELERRRALLRDEAGPSAVLALLGLVYDLHGEIPHEELIALVDAARKHREPLVASYAGYVRGQLLEHEGVAGKQEAEAALRAEGYLLDWQIVGPFDNSGRGGHDQVFEPETAPFSAGQTFVGKLPGEPLPWRQFTHARAPRSGFI